MIKTRVQLVATVWTFKGYEPVLFYKSFDVFGEEISPGVSQLEPVKSPQNKLSLWDDEEDKSTPLNGKEFLNQTFGIFSKITKAIQHNLVIEETLPKQDSVSLKI